MKKLVCSFVLVAALAQAKCQKSDAGPVLQVVLDVGCAFHKAGKVLKCGGKKIYHALEYVVHGLD